MAYHDHELTPAQRQAVQGHLRTCPGCRVRLEQIEARAVQVSARLAMLAPGGSEQMEPRSALGRFRQTILLRKESPMTEGVRINRRIRQWAIGLTALAVLAGLFMLAPVRALASEFLGLFRVEKFVAVDVEPERIEEIASLMDQGMGFGDVQEMGASDEGTEVSSLDEAADLAGFQPRTLGSQVAPDHIVVIAERSAVFTPDVEEMRALFAALDLDPDLLPDDIDGQPFTFTFPTAVAQGWLDEGDVLEVMLMQSPSPTVEGPEDADMQQLGMAMLQLLGMSPREARRLSRDIDWASTLLVPVPANLASVREVEVSGAPGLLFDTSEYVDPEDGGDGRMPGSMLLWQTGGMVYMLSASGVDTVDLIAIAESLN